MLKLSTKHCRALALLAGHPDGCTEALMRAHAVKRAVLAELILAGYVATITAGDFTPGGKLVEVRWIRITDAGRRAMES